MDKEQIMKVKVEELINAPKEEVWKVITNIENSINTISGIEKVEILEQPDDGFVGFKWRETRTFLGQTATEVMWITESVENEYFMTRAESHGAVYTSKIYVADREELTLLGMEFGSKSVTFAAKLMYFFLGWMFIGATKKGLYQDLVDIKNFIEKKD